ncbi:hypothetical protein JQ543_11070 [Bradyrhizobium diazoefficiens]|nr:hypothetical protein [Bradyrhizobium diazoefficiens]MBR0848281.1 hypothetical protein [Bradyrhizobium diazoefficiens]
MGASTLTLTSFILACLLSTWPGNRLVRLVYDLILGRPKEKDRHREFLTSTAWIIGTMERIILIYAMIYSQLSLITGVIILKAFFSWTQSTANPPILIIDPADPAALQAEANRLKGDNDGAMREVLAHYHTYIIGNFLSLLIAIGLYAAAQYLFPPLIETIWARLFGAAGPNVLIGWS